MVAGTSSDTGVPSTLTSGADFDAFLTEVAGQPNADPTSIGHAMDHWQELGTCLASMMQGTDGTESAAGSSAVWGPSVADLLNKHLQTWQGGAKDEFFKQVNIIARFGNAVGRTMYDQTGENTNGYYPESNTFHRALTDIQSSLQFTQQEHQWVNTTFDKWADAIANNVWQFDTRWFRNTTPSDGLPQDWASTHVTIDTNSFQTNQVIDASTTSGWLKVAIQASGAPNNVIWVPAVQDGGSLNSWNAFTFRYDYYVDQSATSVNQIKDQVKQAGDALYAQRLKAIADGIVGDSGDYPKIQQQLPTKVDESALPKGHSSGGGGSQSGGSFGGGSFGGFGGGGGGFGGGGAPGTGSGGLPGGGGQPGTGVGGLPGGGGAPGGGFGGVGGGPGSLGGGSGSTPTHVAGLGGAGVPGGFGGGGGLPGSAGGLANLGSPGGMGAGGAAGAAANQAALAARGEVPLMPPMMPPMMNQNQDNGRQRKSWLPEDEDLWGGAVDTVPPVISSDG